MDGMYDKSSDDIKKFFAGKKILVTGGAGSIGSVIVKHLLKMNPSVVRVLDNSEYNLHNLRQCVCGPNVRLFLGDIRDKERIERAIEGIDIVFHAAALKHVPFCEENPFEAIKTNVMGTQNVIDAALKENVEKFITISTDKAVNPSNVMGATKLLGEKMTTSANYYKGARRTALSCVRFGNVLESSGSVIPLFKEQVRKGGPITVTEPKMTRFMMSKDQAVELILKAAANSHGGEIFILKMDALNIMDLAEVVREELAPKYGFDVNDIKINVRGIREGEKFHEELMTSHEATNVQETNDMFVINPRFKERINGHVSGISSDKVRLLTKDEIKSIINLDQ